MMNPEFETHLKEVYGYFESGDTGLALRRLTDCAIETQQTGIFSETLNYYQWLESNKDADVASQQSHAMPLLEKIRNAGIGSRMKAHDEKILSVHDLNKKYKKGGFSIKNVGFTLNESQITGLVGENGNGKTTLLRLLAAELKPDKGIIEYHFQNKLKSTYDLRTRLIYIEQRIPKWYGTLLDNLNFVLPFYGLKGEENQLWTEIMIARLGLRPFRHLTWNRISSGYRTRFELAKTLLRKPKILLLDEPLANLDINSQQTILQDLKYMANSISAPFGMILSSQHIYEVEKVSDNIIFIQNVEPRYQENHSIDKSEQREDSDALIFELETANDREALNAAFAGLGLQQIKFNGGVYLLYFSKGTRVSSVLESMAAHQIEPDYFRNISQSSRRFFIN
jgi:ABC-2 type transport system ATP-binding protein